MKKSLIQIINEAIEDFYTDWQQNEPSIADRYYEKQLGISPQIQKQEKIDANIVGYVTKQFGVPLKNPEPIPIYKNPKNLDGFGSNTRGILMNNGDLYVSQSNNVAHETILDLLAEHGIIPYASKFNYDTKFPEEFVAVIRIGNSINFGQSSAYDEFPIHYRIIFDNGEKNQPYHFKTYNT